MAAGETATFYIELDGSTTPAPGQSVTIEMDTSAGAAIQYSESADTACATNACVTELRLGTTSFGEASASRSN